MEHLKLFVSRINIPKVRYIRLFSRFLNNHFKRLSKPLKGPISGPNWYFYTSSMMNTYVFVSMVTDTTLDAKFRIMLRWL